MSDNVENSYLDKISQLNKVIIVLDDDPTGTQTVHNVPVYTTVNKENLLKAFDEHKMFFILTNSRSFTKEETIKYHRNLSGIIKEVGEISGQDFIIISRGDSTLRGHFPIETEVINDVFGFHGEIICPFFLEGGRVTKDNIHYVNTNGTLVPAGETEFAKDKTFGYKNSHLGKYIEEKTEGKHTEDKVIYITLDELKNFDIHSIYTKLIGVENFNKVVVNATDYECLKVFTIALVEAMKVKKFIFRSAASLPKVLGNISSIDLLTKDDIVFPQDRAKGGVTIIGSHVQKTSNQLEELKKSTLNIDFIEFNAHRVFEENGLENEVNEIVKQAENNILCGKDSVIYTSRKLVDTSNLDKDEILKISVEISTRLTSIIGSLKNKPKYIIGKGGITSSDVATKALAIKKALVLGQIKKGIPVWLAGEESKFPNMVYIVFPGNVGEDVTLREIIEILD